MAYYTMERRVNRRGRPFLGAARPSDLGLSPQASTVVGAIRQNITTGLFRAESDTAPMTIGVQLPATNVMYSVPAAAQPPTGKPVLSKDAVLVDSQGNIVASDSGMPPLFDSGSISQRYFGDCGWWCPIAAIAGFALGVGVLRVAQG